MWRLLRAVVLIAMAVAIGYWLGYNSKATQVKDKIESSQKAAVDAETTIESLKLETKILNDENETLRKTAINTISALQKSVAGASDEVATSATKLLSKEELGNRLVDLGNKLKTEQ